MNKICALSILVALLLPACFDGGSSRNKQNSKAHTISNSSTNTNSVTEIDTDTNTDSVPTTNNNGVTDSNADKARRSTGCGQNPPPLGKIVAGPGWGVGPDYTYSVKVQETDRSYVLRYPVNYDKSRAYPLVFLFHGTGGNGAEYDYTRVEQTAKNSGAILVLPNGLNYEWANDTGWDTFGVSERDLAFFDVMWQQIRESYCIDESRVFASGHSIGGYMTNYLACERGNILRAIAPIAAGGSWNWALGDPGRSCTGNVAAMILHGRVDDTVNYEWGAAVRDYFLGANACSEVTSPGMYSSCKQYQNCSPNHAVEMCTFSDVNHSDFDWNVVGKLIWNFFEEQR